MDPWSVISEIVGWTLLIVIIGAAALSIFAVVYVLWGRVKLYLRYRRTRTIAPAEGQLWTGRHAVIVERLISEPNEIGLRRGRGSFRLARADWPRYIRRHLLSLWERRDHLLPLEPEERARG